jgi:CheY-like chemotaxis protein
LVVDDNVDGAEMLALFLDLSGHSTRLAHSGREALALVEEFEPQIVFLDIGLPDMSGYEVARALRSRSSALRPRLVAVTGWGAEEDRRLAHDAGFDDHLVKPVDTKSVRELVEREGEKHWATQ